MDFGVYDWEIQLPGLINPDAYASREPWKIHTVDPFQYFPDTTRNALLSKMIRKAEPRSGKIDYDVGALSGNWFQQGTDWYNGINQRKYWEGHLSIDPHEIDPNLWRIGIGFLDVDDNNFILVGKHDPVELLSISNPVSYELKRHGIYISSQPEKNWWSDPYSENDVYGVRFSYEFVGTILLDLQSDGLLKVEFFQGKSSEEIIRFTENYRLYTR